MDANFTQKKIGMALSDAAIGQSSSFIQKPFEKIKK